MSQPVNRFSLYHITEGTVNFVNLGATAADDYLAKLSDQLIPVRLRTTDFHLPETDLLKSIHYYVAHNYQEHFGLFDESALLALGYLVEHWVEEELDHKTHLQYAQTEGTDEALEKQRLTREARRKREKSMLHQKRLSDRLESERKRALESDNDNDADENTTEKKESITVKREATRQKKIRKTSSAYIASRSRRLRSILSNRGKERSNTGHAVP